jgi:dCMP deaminase
MKRTNYTDWNTFFMSVAVLSSKRSKDPVSQVGACITDKENKIVSVGYNGFPRGCSDDIFPWGKDSPEAENNKYSYVIHAEMNSILNKNTVNLDNCVLYTTLFPCCECTKVIIQSGIKTIWYLDYREDLASLRMIAATGVKCEQLTL